MTKKEFITKLAERSGATKQNSEIFASAYADVLAECLKNGESVTIQGVGKLTGVTKPAHKGRNPRTGEEVDVPDKKSVKFKLTTTWNSDIE